MNGLFADVCRVCFVPLGRPGKVIRSAPNLFLISALLSGIFEYHKARPYGSCGLGFLEARAIHAAEPFYAALKIENIFSNA